MFESNTILNNAHRIHILLESFVFSKWSISISLSNISRKTEPEYNDSL
jgi:hypothetical protein